MQTSAVIFPVLAESSGHTVPVIHPAAADGVFSLLWVIIALPALGAAVILLGGNTRTKGWAHLLGVGTVAASFVLSLVSFFALLGRDDGGPVDRPAPLHLGRRRARSRPRPRCSTTRSRRCSCC